MPVNLFKNVLNINDTKDIFFEDTSMIGIVSALPSYRLCWVLNSVFDISFSRVYDYDIILEKTYNRFYYPHYIFNLPDSSNLYRFYSLKNGSEPLLPELKHFDFLWLIQTTTHQDDVFKILSVLKNVKEVNLVRIFTLDQIRTCKNLLV